MTKKKQQQQKTGKKDFLATAHFHTLNTMGWVSNKREGNEMLAC